MPDILHDFPINASADRVFAAISTPSGLDLWWSKKSDGVPQDGQEFALDFGPGFAWRAMVTRCIPPTSFELTLTQATDDWIGSRVGFDLVEGKSATSVRFYHSGWREVTGHFRTSSFCWAMYLRLLRLHLEGGLIVPYERRLEV